jgi:predicted amidophosphoribosyltransferase
MHWYRRLRRGYNQALLIAEGAGRAVGIPTVDVLRRVRSSPTQVGLSREERWVNPAETMMVRRAGPVVGRRVAVVDDVLTTCATASECARVLREAGAQDVVVVAAVRQR